MSTPVEKIKERLTITEVIESYMKLDRAGSNLKGKCPFHNEKTPSFFVSPDRGSYYCFGCGVKGDMFSFVQAFEGLDFMGSLKLLAARAGIPLTYEKPELKSERDHLYEIMETATEFYEAALWNTGNIAALEYLKKRGLTEETIKEFRLGFALNDWRTLYTYLKNKKYTDAEIEKAGLTKRAEQAEKGFYDRFRGRIMFPISDSGGRVIAFTGRILEDDGKSAKYLNSPETPIFTKASVLYGIDKAKLAIRKMNYSVLVEGQMDLILSHQAGFKNTVAGSGTALTDTLSNKDNVVNNLGIVKRISTNIIMVYDSDKAGVNAALRSAQIALSLGMDVKIGQVPDGKDPADLILKDKDAWKDVLKNAKPVVEFALNTVLDQEPDPRKQPKLINEKVLPFLAVLSSHMEKSHFIAMIHGKTDLSEEAIWTDLKLIERDFKNQAQAVVSAGKFPSPSSPSQSGKPGVIPATPKAHRKDSSVKKVFGILFWKEGKPDPAVNVAVFRKKLEAVLGDAFAAAEADALPLKNELMFEAEVMNMNSQQVAKDLDEMILQIEEDLLKEEFAATMHELTSAERSKDDARAMELLHKCQALSKKIAEIAKRKTT